MVLLTPIPLGMAEVPVGGTLRYPTDPVFWGMGVETMTYRRCSQERLASRT